MRPTEYEVLITLRVNHLPEDPVTFPTLDLALNYISDQWAEKIHHVEINYK